MSKTVKTKKGTELSIMSLKGKDYMQVQQRLIWFVEENPRYDITTDFMKLDDEMAIARCVVSVLEDTPQGVRVVRKVTDYKSETQQGFADYVEKAATGALGRCLAVLGYGTQFAAADLDEGDRIVDSPVASKTGTAVTETNGALSATTSVAVLGANTTPASSGTEVAVKTMPMAIPTPATGSKANKFARSKPASGSL